MGSGIKMRKKVISEIRHLKEKLRKNGKFYKENRELMLLALAILSLRYQEQTAACDRVAKSIDGLEEYEQLKDKHYRRNMCKSI